MVLETAYVAWHTLLLVCVVAGITVLGLVVCGKLKLPDGPPPRRWQVAFGILATLLLAGTLLP